MKAPPLGGGVKQSPGLMAGVAACLGLYHNLLHEVYKALPLGGGEVKHCRYQTVGAVEIAPCVKVRLPYAQPIGIKAGVAGGGIVEHLPQNSFDFFGCDLYGVNIFLAISDGDKAYLRGASRLNIEDDPGGGCFQIGGEFADIGQFNVAGAATMKGDFVHVQGDSGIFDLHNDYLLFFG